MSSNNTIFTISEITKYIKDTIDQDAQLSNVWLRGEISNFTHHGSGHMYFSLKDESSKLRAIMFAGNNRYMKFIPKNGTKVLARGYISVYERDGQYQFYIQEMQPDGIGQLYLAYEQLKESLEQEGLFRQEYKKALPSFPKVIGIITSTTGAAIRDIITTISRRYPAVDLLIYPVLVQGESAAASIAHAIDQLNVHNQCDLLIVGRGGGSIEELWAFNEEIVARSIFKSKIPIISAVGHETDFTIADFVADIRAATPTAAAELAVPHINELRMRISYLNQRLERNIRKQLEQSKKSLASPLRSLVFRRPKQRWIESAQQLDHLLDRLNHSLPKYTKVHSDRLNFLHHRLTQVQPKRQVSIYKEEVQDLRNRLIRGIQSTKKENSVSLTIKLKQLDALSPLKVMQRGYGLLYDEKEKTLIKSIGQVNLGDIVRLRLHDGKLNCQIWGMEANEDGL